MTLAEAIRRRTEDANMPPAQALAYMIGATEARVILATASADALAAHSKGSTRNA